MGKFRPRISHEEFEIIKGIREQCKSHDLSIKDVPYGWVKSKESSLFFRNPKFGAMDDSTFKEELLHDIRTLSPKRKEINVSENGHSHLLVIDPADIHIGKLASSFETGDEYSVETAMARVILGIKGIVSKAQGFNIDKIAFMAGNDILHIDTPKRTTTSGTPQDTDGMWYDNFRKAFALYIAAIDYLSEIAPVFYIHNPSNHDFQSGFFLSQAVEAYFHNNKNVTFDCSMRHRKYFVYGENLIGTTHGDGAKVQDLPLLMAHESPDWSSTKHRYIYTHHIHHKMAKDYMGVCVESLRSPSGSDGWHHRNGYQHAPKAIEGFIHHKEFGQVARLTHIF
jgi:hypothetical protein